MKRNFIFVAIVFTFISIYSQLFAQGLDFKRVNFGIDVLIESKFANIKGKKIALVCNSASRNNTGKLTAEILAENIMWELKYILVPEHGFYTSVPAGEYVDNDTIGGVPVISLYGKSRKPDAGILQRCDLIVIDIQDIGVRSYTYISSVFNTLQACAELNIPVLILDRPNPLGGMIVDGLVTENGNESFVSIVPVSYLHGLTIGELALMMNQEKWIERGSSKQKIKCELTILKMENWERWMHWEDTELTWFPTSPHIPTVNSIRGAATLGIWGELGIFSIGIGTTSPFQYLGYNQFDINLFEQSIGKLSTYGVHLSFTKYRPFYGMYSGKYINGYMLSFDKANDSRLFSAGILFAKAMKDSHPKLFNPKSLNSNGVSMFCKVTGTTKLYDAFIANKSKVELMKIANSGLEDYLKLRAKYLLY